MMKLNPQVDVIIPTYNNQDTIKRAINSVIAQTYKNWRLIIINDCSTDNTKSIIESYNDKRIILINNEVNLGAGVSRQVGLKATKASYITFLDSDDYLKPDFIEMNVKLALQHDSDIVYTSFGIEYPHPTKKYEKVIQVIPSGDYIMSGEATPQLHFWAQKKFLTGKLFKTNILRKIKWSNKRIGEDVQTLFFATYEADKVRSSSYCGYIHVFREGSLLANAPYFLCYCGSTEAEIEMCEYLYKKKDRKILKYLMNNMFNNYIQVKKLLLNKQIPQSDFEKHKSSWNYISNWIERHTDWKY